MASKLCDSCKSATATLFCRADSAFLCVSCDAKVHAANKLASRHGRVWVCEVCEQAPAHVTCKADAAALCIACDRDIHSANPLARRHERVPVVPLYEAATLKPNSAAAAANFLDADDRDADADSVTREEAEAESWLLPNPKAGDSPDLNTGQYMFSEVDPYLDLEYGPADPKLDAQDQDQDRNSSGTDGVVPVQSKTLHAPVVNDHCYDAGFAKPYGFGFNTPCLNLSQSVSSSSMEVGVVPDANNMSDVSNPYSYSKAASNGGYECSQHVAPISSAEREARVLRYREKRKNRKFEKTIRYASRKAYAETRPRIKGRFAKRTDLEPDVDRAYGYGVVPSY